MLGPLDLLLLGLAGVGAGAINALAGGGSILTFPALIAIGIPPVAANVTNTVALCPGYVGGVLGQRRDLSGQERRALLLLPAAVAGGIAGGVLLLASGDRLFASLVPLLVVAACALLLLQDRLRALLARRSGLIGLGAAALLVALASVYGGYFGAGLSVMLLAVLGLALEDSLTRLNALKQLLSLAVNVAAALLFVAADQVVWPAAAAMAAGALGGGMLGGRLASLVAPATLRRIVVAVGLGVAALFLLRF
jgi:uncharacterized membrane protein YfcA